MKESKDFYMISKAANPVNMTTEIIYTWDNGREEVRYRRTTDSREALQLISQIEVMKAKYKDTPYSWRNVESNG